LGSFPAQATTSHRDWRSQALLNTLMNSWVDESPKAGYPALGINHYLLIKCEGTVKPTS